MSLFLGLNKYHGVVTKGTANQSSQHSFTVTLMACSDSTETKSALFISGNYFKSKHTKVYRVCSWKQKLVTDSKNQKANLTIRIIQGFFFFGLLAIEQMTLLLQRDWWHHPCCNVQSCVRNALCSKGWLQRNTML